MVPGQHVWQELERQLDIVEFFLQASQSLLNDILSGNNYQDQLNILTSLDGWTVPAVHVAHNLVDRVLGLKNQSFHF